MTLSTTTSRTSASGNGSTTSFAFSFKIWAASNLVVYLVDTTTLVETLQVLNTDYTVDIVSYPNTGNVVFTTAPASGKTVVIVRVMPLTQELDLTSSGAFPADSVEMQLDKLAAEIQTLRGLVARCIQIPIGSSLTDIPLVAPTAAADGYVVTYDDGGEGFVLSAATDLDLTLVSPYAAGLLDDTNAAAALATLGLVGKQTIWIPAVSMISRTTNGAAAGTAETSTNKQMLKTLDFDTTTQEFAQFTVRFPKAWNEGTLTAVFYWSHGSTTTNFGVVWGLQGVAISNDDALDVAFGTAQEATDTGGTTDDLYASPETSAITVSGTPAAGDIVKFQVYRKPADAGDTLAIDARLHGITLFWTNDTVVDD